MQDLVAQARAATVAKDADAAKILWLEVATSGGLPVSLIREVAGNLKQYKLLHQVDALLAGAVNDHPTSLEVYFDYAKSASALQMTQEEENRWSVITTKFPQHVHGYLGESRLAARRGDVARAEVVIAEGLAKVGPDERLLIEHAMCAETRGEWEQAIGRWRTALSQKKVGVVPWYRLGAALMRSGSLEDAAQVLHQGLGLWPGDVEIRTQLAQLATRHEDWDGALQIWTGLLKQFPDDGRFISEYGQALWRRNLNGSGEAGGDDLDRPADVGLVQDTDLLDLMLLFESLGQNCEFGLVQRRFGAEPLGLLRWTTTYPKVLLAGLKTQFAGVGEPANTVLDFAKNEIMINDLSNNIRFHTFVQSDAGLDVDKLRNEQARHLAYLRKIFLERLEDDDKIYVYKVDEGCSETDIEAIYSELQKYGEKTLLFVERAGPNHVAGSVRAFRPHWYRGYVSRFGRDDSASWNIDFDSWLSICKQTVEAIHERAAVLQEVGAK